MPFQPQSSIDTAIWRFQTKNQQNQVTSEIYVNLGLVRYMKTTRVNAPVIGGQTNMVSIWYYGNVASQDPEVVLNGAAADAFLADLDTLFS